MKKHASILQRATNSITKKKNQNNKTLPVSYSQNVTIKIKAEKICSIFWHDWFVQ